MLAFSLSSHFLRRPFHFSSLFYFYNYMRFVSRSEAERLKKELAETTLVNNAQAEDILAVKSVFLRQIYTPRISDSTASDPSTIFLFYCCIVTRRA